MNNSTVGQTSQEDKCSYSPPMFLEERFYLVTVFGSLVAIIGIIENVFLFCMLARKRKHRNSSVLYLLLLAFFDIVIAAAYIPLMSVSLLLDYVQSVILLRSWYSYMVPIITISHISISSGTFLIVAASFERYAITACPSKVRFLNKYRRQIAAFAVGFAILTKISLSFEFKIIFQPECFNTMAEFNLEVSELSKNYLYELIWRIGFRNLITVILPFFVLVIINGRVIYILATSPDSTTTTNTSTDFMTTEYQRKLRVRVATKTLLCVVFTYLLSNLLNVIITFWEYIDMYTLQFVHVQFYTFAVDLVSISTVLAGMFRLPIYASCMPELRKEFRTYFHKLLHPDEYETMLMIKKKPNFLKRLVMSDHKGKDVFLSIGTMLIVKHKNSYDTQSLKDTESEGEETSIDENQNCIPPIGSITEMPSNQITNPPPQVSNSSCLTLFTGIISNNNSKDDDDEIFL